MSNLVAAPLNIVACDPIEKMQISSHGQDHVAPLRIRKSEKDLRDAAGLTVNTEKPLPIPNQVEMFEGHESYSPRPSKFQNFLRASYPFQPPEHSAATTVTLPLATGDIILVHSIHTNGWADGTLLETGARGWLPTNYCEGYDYATMRPLLKALTEFWDVIRNTGQTTLSTYSSHDYMRGMVAGVRFLLEKSNCLTRDAILVRQYDDLRKIRKNLLADLSVLVKTSKEAQLSELEASMMAMDAILDHLLLKAFQVVTRAVIFFDAWSVIAGFSPMVSGTPILFQSSPIDATTTIINTNTHTSYRSSTYRSQSAGSVAGSVIHHFSKPRPASISRPPVVTHRMPYMVGSVRAHEGNLASEQLSDTYDAFLGVLASFLGSHMQSRSSSELLLTTQQAVKSCRKLLEIIEIILEHNSTYSDDLLLAKDAMYERIHDLVSAAREVFPPMPQADDEEMIYLPDQGAELVNAATACVKSAGLCVAKGRLLLEDIGDFELELRQDTAASTSLSEHHSFVSVTINSDSPSHMSGTDTVTSGHSVRPAIEVAHDFLISASVENTINMTPATVSTTWTTTTDESQDLPSPTSMCSVEISAADPIQTSIVRERSLNRAILHGSESTLVSSARDSGPSFISQTSTRATSPESHFKGSPSKYYDDDHDYLEETVMELQFAHELVINPEGRVIGGSLNAIIERLTSHESIPEPSFISMLYLTFRLFATPLEFAESLAYRFDNIEQSPRIAQTVRLRVTNILKGWLESHWRHDCDESSIPFIESFIREKISHISSVAGRRLLELLDTVITTHAPAVPRVLSAMGKTNTVASVYLNPDQPIPQPILSKSQLDLLKIWKMGGAGLSIDNFDSMEIARQLTIKTSDIFCSILPEELLGAEFTKKSSSLAVNVRAMSALSNDLANFVVDSILQLDIPKKRAAVIKQWVKVASKCLILHNYDTLMAIVASISSTSVQRLKKTWDQVGPKTKTMLDELKAVVDHARNYSGLRQRFQNHCTPCLPYVGIYLTDLTFIDQGNSSTRELNIGDSTISVINVDKHMKTAKVISDLQRFQIKYRLTCVDELQTWLQDEFIRVRAAGERNFQNQWRRSLLIEPRDNQILNKPTKISAFASMTSLTNRDKFDLLSWTHTSKERHNSVGS